MQYPGRPGSPGNPITSPGFPSGTPSIDDLVDRGQYVRTNRDNHGSERGYLNAIRRVPNYTAGNATFFETPADRANNGGTPLKPVPGGGRPAKPRSRANTTPLRGGGTASIANFVGGSPAAPQMGPAPAGRYNAAQEIPAGTPEANYAAGLRTYGASGRSAPNVGAVRNKGGYNERDQRIAARNSRAKLAAGDEQSRVRLLGG